MFRRARVAALAFILTAAPALAGQLADQPSRRQAIELFRTGQEFMSAEQFERAADAFTKAKEKDPLLSIAHYGIGQANMNLRRYDNAIKAYKDCIEAMRTLHGLQQTNRFEVDKQREDEIRELRGVLDRSSKNGRAPTVLALEQRLRDLENQRASTGSAFRPPAEVLLALGSAYFRNGDRDAAEAMWKASVDVNPKYGEAHNNLSVIYMQTGRLSEAEFELKLAEKNGFRVNPQLKADLRDRQKAAGGR
jgi:tetratricopeptide (TPR) repeat protein